MTKLRRHGDKLQRRPLAGGGSAAHHGARTPRCCYPLLSVYPRAQAMGRSLSSEQETGGEGLGVALGRRSLAENAGKIGCVYDAGSDRSCRRRAHFSGRALHACCAACTGGTLTAPRLLPASNPRCTDPCKAAELRQVVRT